MESADLKPAERQVLTTLNAALEELEGLTLVERLQGDARPTGLYARRLSLRTAQAVVDWTLKAWSLDLEAVKVVFTGRNTTRVRGRFRVGLKGIIFCHRPGENMGTVLHELAHAIGNGREHGEWFKLVHGHVLDLWEMWLDGPRDILADIGRWRGRWREKALSHAIRKQRRLLVTGTKKH